MNAEWSLIDAQGRRKYLVEKEYAAFITAAERLPPRERAFCLTLAGTGARISEANALRKRDIDRASGNIIIRSLKKRDRISHREIPVQPNLIATLDLVFDLGRGKADHRLWDVNIATAYRWVIKAMRAADLNFSPHALRHTFGARAVEHGVPLTAIKAMLGHHHVTTTAIYTNLVGKDLRKQVEKMWG